MSGNLWIRHLRKNWRPAIRGFNKDFYSLRVMLPKSHLDFTSTTKKDLAYKAIIEKYENDPFNRLKLLQRAKEEGNANFVHDLYH